jgi:hypothetical protein
LASVVDALRCAAEVRRGMAEYPPLRQLMAYLTRSGRIALVIFFLRRARSANADASFLVMRSFAAVTYGAILRVLARDLCVPRSLLVLLPTAEPVENEETTKTVNAAKTTIRSGSVIGCLP